MRLSMEFGVSERALQELRGGHKVFVVEEDSDIPVLVKAVFEDKSGTERLGKAEEDAAGIEAALYPVARVAEGDNLAVVPHNPVLVVLVLGDKVVAEAPEGKGQASVNLP